MSLKKLLETNGFLSRYSALRDRQNLVRGVAISVKEPKFFLIHITDRMKEGRSETDIFTLCF